MAHKCDILSGDFCIVREKELFFGEMQPSVEVVSPTVPVDKCKIHRENGRADEDEDGVDKEDEI
eukprot:CAMPEP_0202050524 /NCGR_PEP_ID=MMETSP0963-20130614/4057_1 /ASSEMBLY_ACC=CAM_ASM_000494 /TAXON_ID=4773 /ORGANISM="Schizochytrium aggregatum, Strain ATCC28209" /LENGTH=63 /DNA_ID=CAMNT_0048615621 /DNA_START=396 /DNA_END=587 /DNA_ORIENTATION=-